MDDRGQGAGTDDRPIAERHGSTAVSVALEAKHRVVADRMNTGQSPVDPLDHAQAGVKGGGSRGARLGSPPTRVAPPVVGSVNTSSVRRIEALDAAVDRSSRP